MTSQEPGAPVGLAARGSFGVWLCVRSRHDRRVEQERARHAAELRATVGPSEIAAEEPAIARHLNGEPGQSARGEVWAQRVQRADQIAGGSGGCIITQVVVAC